MGAFWRGIPTDLLSWAKDSLPEDSIAVETGTYLGDGANLLSINFKSVVTFERDALLAANASKRFQSNSKIKVVEGSTRVTFQEFLPKDQSGILFWLDAHYSGGVTAGSDDPCPLMHEIEVIFKTRTTSNTIILIDDVRGLIGSGGWPSLVDVCSLGKENGYSGAVIDDVLVLVDESKMTSLSNILPNSRAVQMSSISQYWSAMVLTGKIMKITYPFYNLFIKLKNIF